MLIPLLSALAFNNFTSLSSKEPDLFVSLDTHSQPQLGVESGWTESYPRLLADKNLWMGGMNNVQLVIILRWSKISNQRMKGFAELWSRSQAPVTLVNNHSS